MTTTVGKTQELIERHRKYMLPVQTKMLYYGERPLAVERAKDQYLWDVEGNRYLDFFGGILTVSVGHCNEEVVEATARQMRRAGHTSTLYLNEIMIDVAEKIAQITPGRLQHTFFTNSGSEANETAIMAARAYTGNTDVLALRHAYSGRTSAMMGITAHSTWRQGGVYDGAIKHVRSPNLYRRPEGMSEEQYLDFLVEDLNDFIETCTDGRIAAFIAEPIQGVGGFAVIPRDYFKRVEPVVRAAGGVMIIDEVQTGWGRTGRYWCGIEHWGIEPDIMTFAKGIANGAPVGATTMTPEIAEAVRGLTLSTYGGNPVSMAQTLATIEYIEKHRLWENAERQGARLRERMETMAAQSPLIGDVRGMGLMQAFEFVNPGTKDPNAGKATEFVNKARDNGLLIGKGGRHSNTIRIAPHLNVTANDLETGCDLLEKSLREISQA